MKLEIGMNIYSNERLGGGIRRYTVKKVTEKQAVIEEKYGSGEIGEVRFDREQRETFGFYAKGDKTGWNRTVYYSETPELIAQYHREILERKYARIDVKKLTNGQLENIIKEAENSAN